MEWMLWYKDIEEKEKKDIKKKNKEKEKKKKRAYNLLPTKESSYGKGHI